MMQRRIHGPAIQLNVACGQVLVQSQLLLNLLSTAFSVSATTHAAPLFVSLQLALTWLW